MALDLTTDIAIVGMACRYPGAPDLDAFWQLLCEGKEGIRHFTETELLESGVPPEDLADPQYVRAYGWLEGIEYFDAAFFGYDPLEARLMDPQHRLFLELCWHALEHAGIRPDRVTGPAAVFGGTGQNAYRLRNLASRPDVLETAGKPRNALANDPDFLSARASYKLGLTGPSMDVQTACSTSLVATHLAVQTLLSGEADLALAGGASIVTTRKEGYHYVPEGTYSPDGHTRTFDARAQGMVGGDGAGVLVLKRLEDALNDRNTVYAVIKGTAVNNDGADRIGFTAPGTAGQARVIAEAQSVAGVAPDDIAYIELHGTATPLGDPIEFAALSRAFAGADLAPGSIGLGSVKSNIGHTNAAAGAAGLIKVALSLHHGELPPSLHFETPNPEIPLAGSPFYVNAARKPWNTPGRLAGVSSFGMGGTNAHAVLAEGPQVNSGPGIRPFELLTISAATTSALEKSTAALASGLTKGDQHLADTAYTLHTGRHEMAHRRVMVAASAEQAAEALQARSPQRVFTAKVDRGNPPVAFLLPGQGAQYPGMAHGLYASEPVFRRWLDRCAEYFSHHLDRSLNEILFPDNPESGLIHQTRYTQPAVFAVSYAAARLFMAWGIRPAALLGHSIGELTAACLAGVFTLEDACRVVSARGAAMYACEPGGMLSVSLQVEELQHRLPDGIEIAVINEPGAAVVSGSLQQIERFESALQSQGVACRRVRTSHAFHSAMMEPALKPFRDVLETVPLNPPDIPFISNVTGGWISPTVATDPGYWTIQVRSPVQFASGLQTLNDLTESVMLETGPGAVLSAFARRNGAAKAIGDGFPITAGRHPQDPSPDAAVLTTALSQLWLSGLEIDWAAYHAHEHQRSVALPLYPFEKQRHWVAAGDAPGIRTDQLVKNPSISRWFYAPSWERIENPAAKDLPTDENWLLFIEEEGQTEIKLANKLEKAGARVVAAPTGAQPLESARTPGLRYPGMLAGSGDVDELAAFLQNRDFRPDRIVHFSTGQTDPEEVLQGLLRLTRLIDRAGWADQMEVIAVTRGGQEVLGREEPLPAPAAAVGFGRVVPQEFPGIIWRTIDLDPTPQEAETEALLAAILATAPAPLTALRGRYRWEQQFETLRLPPRHYIRKGGVYLITGGLGAIGQALSEKLLREFGARVAVISRSAAPDDPRLHGLAGFAEHLMVLRADVADSSQMEAALADIEARFGPLNGVFHAAGRTAQADFHYLPETTPADFNAHLRPKLYGAEVLAEALNDRVLDFCLLFSSVSSVLGGLGFAAYAAANAALEAVAARMNHQRAFPWISLASEGWAIEGAEPGRLGTTLAGLAMHPEEGVDAVLRAVAARHGSQVILSTADLETRIRRWQQPETATAMHPVDAERPDLDTGFQPPRSTAEKEIQGIWEQLLGFSGIGVLDDFFQLGGHSLLATQVLNEIRKRHPHARLSLGNMFEQPTIAGLAALVDSAPALESPEIPPEFPPDVDRMSDEEVEAMLRQLLDDDEV